MKRRLLASILSLVMVLSLLPTAVMANDGDEVASEREAQSELSGDCGANGDNVTWTLTGDEGAYTLTISGNGAMADYATGGAQPWVSQKANIKHVVIEGGVTSIGERAFMGFSALEDVVIPDSVTSYGTNAFHSCTSLSALNIGMNVSSIGQIGIYLDTAMTALTIDAQNNSYAVIDNWLYELNDDDTAYLWQVPAGVIKDAATITVPDTIEWNGASYVVIGVGKATADSYTLAGAASVTSVNLSSNAKEIGANAFYGANELANIDISHVTAIGSAAFMNCSELTDVTFADGLTTIGTTAFQKTGLTEVKLPAALTYLGKAAFGNCDSLETVIIKSDTLEIGPAAFNANKKLEVLDLSAVKNLTLTGGDALAINRSGAVLLTCYVAGETQKTLLDNQFTVGTVAFAVTDNGTFSDDTTFITGELAEPTKPNYDFDGWYKDADVNTPAGNLTAGETYYAKWAKKTAMNGDCSATEQDNVSWKLEENGEGTYTLTISGTGDVADYLAPGEFTWGKDEAGNKVRVWVSKTDLSVVAPWFAVLNDKISTENHVYPITEIVVENGVTGIGNCAFVDTQITEVSFASSVEKYGVNIYTDCPYLEKVDWTNFAPKAVRLDAANDDFTSGAMIPGHMFDRDFELDTSVLNGTTYPEGELVLPDSVVGVGTSSFYGTAFSKVDFKTGLKGVRQVNRYSFASMPNLTSLMIPGDMKFILGGNNNICNVFSGDSNVTSVLIEEGMTIIPPYMEENCSSLETLSLPSTVTNIGIFAFSGAVKLYSVDMSKITGSLTVDRAFYTGGTPADCIFYVNNTDVQKVLLADNWGNRFNGNASKSTVIYAVTDGGTFPDTVTFEAGELATPEKAGYKFLGWYTEDGSSNNEWGTEVQTPTAGKTYYAKWADLNSEFTLAGGETTVTATYDPNGGVTLTVAASNAGLPLTGCTYEWYKDGEKIANTDASLKLTDVADSGEYQVKITNADEKWTALTDEVTVTITKATQDISYATKSVSKRIGAADFTNKLTVNEDKTFGEITYESSNESVAKVNETTGEVTIVGVGTAVITATAAGSDNYDEVSDSYTLTVSRRATAPSATTPDPDPEPEETVKFTDVPKSAYYYDAVEWAVGKEITDGMSATMFGPYEPCTRAQIVTFLWRAAGSPEPKATTSAMTDLNPNAYYYKAVLWAIENGITDGMTETTFAPNATCTRGQSVTFLYRALGKKVESSANFTDVKSDAFYADAVNWAVANNVTNGTSNTTFSPNADCTRAEIVTFLYRAYQGK